VRHKLPIASILLPYFYTYSIEKNFGKCKQIKIQINSLDLFFLEKDSYKKDKTINNNLVEERVMKR
jgi:hypothetical protein